MSDRCNSSATERFGPSDRFGRCSVGVADSEYVVDPVVQHANRSRTHIVPDLGHVKLTDLSPPL